MLQFIPLLCIGCAGNERQVPNERDRPIVTRASALQDANSLTEWERQEGWKLLFDGTSTDGWRKVYGKEFPAEGWIVEDGQLIVQASGGQHAGGGGSIVTESRYSDFELKLEFKMTKGANSGIKYFVVEDPGFFEGDPAGKGIGLEYQIIDDENHPDAAQGMNGNRTLGSLYDMIPADRGKKVRPIGEWNHARLISKGAHVEHWLNGEKVLEYERGSDAFRALVDHSKYSVYEHFGQAPEGHILLQDHGNRVAFRNIKIRELENGE